jgi:hypothetical protein
MVFKNAGAAKNCEVSVGLRPYGRSPITPTLNFNDTGVAGVVGADALSLPQAVRPRATATTALISLIFIAVSFD